MAGAESCGRVWPKNLSCRRDACSEGCGPDGYRVARNWVSSGECRPNILTNIPPKAPTPSNELFGGLAMFVTITL